MDQPLTAQEAADELGYNVCHMYKLLKKGTLKAEQFNRVWMVPRQEVERIKTLQGPGAGSPRLYLTKTIDRRSG